MLAFQEITTIIHNRKYIQIIPHSAFSVWNVMTRRAEINSQ